MPIARLIAFASIVASAGGAAAASAQPVLAAMTEIRAGRWEVVAEGQEPRALCVVHPEALFQLNHRGSACTRLVIADAKSSATVHYSCPGAGWGRTTLRISTPEVVRIATQGIAENAPFNYQARAHRLGDCSTRGGGR